MPHHNKKEDNSGISLNPDILELLAKFQEIEIEDFELEVGEMELIFEPGMARRILPKLLGKRSLTKPVNILKTEFFPPIESYSGKIVEVKLGATKSEGGSRGRSFVVGGETSPA
ncbi:hypothetical protein MUO66_07880, partial [Candidatus Bathyarchaeota archaeon]|nr:hypothetical protein [Candidatus Bathyarchaeota archaeon]